MSLKVSARSLENTTLIAEDATRPLSKNQIICRTCLRVIDTDKSIFYNMNSITSPNMNPALTIGQKLAACIPEVALCIILDANICGLCATSLHWAFEFRKNCLRTEDIICNYIVDGIQGDIKHHIELEEVTSWNNQKSIKKLKCVDILGESSFTDVSYINPGNVKETEVKEELLLEDDIQNFLDKTTNNDVGCCMKYEEVQVKEEPHLIDLKEINAIEDVKYEKVDISELPTSSSTEADGLHICDKCKAQFSLKCDYRLHKILHVQDTSPYQCDECEFLSPNQNTLRRHLLINHTKERKFKCKLCGLEINDLNYHDMQNCKEEKVHTASAAKRLKLQDFSSQKGTNLRTNKAYKCNLCDCQCTSELMLINHKKRHDEIMPLMCSICKKSFKEVLDLNEHLIVHSELK